MANAQVSFITLFPFHGLYSIQPPLYQDMVCSIAACTTVIAAEPALHGEEKPTLPDSIRRYYSSVPSPVLPSLMARDKSG